MGQVFVGLYQGKGELKKIGPCVWQLIWFSLFSLMLTFPLSQVASYFYFKGTAIHQVGVDYFDVLSKINFLFPMSVALASFYLGRGQTTRVTFLTLISYSLNISLSWCFILGLGSILPSLGAKGAPIAKSLGVAFLCCSLFISFISKKNQAIYHTHEWRFSPSMLWEIMRPGLVRAFGYLYSKVCWAGISYLMMKKGGLHSDVLTVGGVVISFMTFVASASYRTILTISSNLIGSNQGDEMKRFYRSLGFYIMIVAASLAILLLLFPETLIFFFDASSKALFRAVFPTISIWVWMYLTALVIQLSICSLVVSARDLKWLLFSYISSPFISLLPVYLTLYIGGWSSDRLWLIMAIENVLFASYYLFRLYKKHRVEKESSLLTSR
jgi:MATE family multidrug resistance protein